MRPAFTCLVTLRNEELKQGARREKGAGGSGAKSESFFPLPVIALSRDLQFSYEVGRFSEGGRSSLGSLGKKTFGTRPSSDFGRISRHAE